MPTEITDAEDKYRRKVLDEDDLDVSVNELVDIVNGGTVIKTIPVKNNPSVTYGVDEEGGGGGNGQKGGKGSGNIKFGVDRRQIVELEKGWGLKFTKPGTKKNNQMDFLISENGMQENDDETLGAMLERQMATKTYKTPFKIDVKEEDVRYDIVKDKPNPERKATFIVMKDVSGSMWPVENLTNKIALYIAVWLQEIYKDQVTRAYIVHTEGAMEVPETMFFSTEINGGTDFVEGYKTIHAMLNGTAYRSYNGYHRKIDANNEDVYILHITDGEIYSPPEETLSEIRPLLPKITKLMYLQVKDTGAKDGFYKDLAAIKDDKVKLSVSKNDLSNANVKRTLTELLA